MNNLKNIFGIIILPFVAIAMLILSPVLMLIMWWNLKDEVADYVEEKRKAESREE